MTDDRIESNDEKATRLRQWFLETAQHPVWERPVTRPPEGDGGGLAPAGRAMTGDYAWIVCRGADGEVMGAVGMPALDMSPEAVEARAQARREWLEARYPGPATGRDPEEVRRIAERKRKEAQGGA